MIRWLRVLMPVRWLWPLFFLYLMAEGPALYLEMRLHIREQEFHHPSIALLHFTAVFYAIYRVARFHPLWRPGYRSWLESTPWTSRQPLPHGPVHLVVQDVFYMGILVLLGWPFLGVASLTVVQAFLVSYALILIPTLWLTEEKYCAYAVAFGCGLMVHSRLNWLAFVPAALTTYLLTYWGLRRSLGRFPWDPAWINFAKRLTEMDIGWPFSRLGPKFPNAPHIHLVDASLTSLLGGWWFFVLLSILESMPRAKGEVSPSIPFYFMLLTVVLTGQNRW